MFSTRRFLPVFALVLALAVPAASGTLDARSIREVVFPSGLRLITRESHANDLAAIQVWVRAGGFLEDAADTGYAHIIEHLVFRGTDRRGTGGIDQEIEDLGGELSAATEKDWTMFETTVASMHVGKVIDVVADAVRNPKFRTQDWALEKPLLLDELSVARSDPERLVSTALFNISFERHPYRRDVRGSEAIFNTLNLESLRAYYQKYYVGPSMTVLVVGDINHAAIERQVRTAFAGDTPAGKTPPYELPAPEKACEKPRREVVPVPFRTGFIGMAFPAPAVTDLPDVYAMDILVTLLEQGPYGRLPTVLRGRVGAVKATYETRRQAGLLTIFAQADPGALDAVEKSIRDEVGALQTKPPTQAEVDFTRRLLAGSYALDNETFSGQANSLGFYAAIDRWQFATTYLDRIGLVTPDEVLATARKYLNPERSCTVILRPARTAAEGS